MAGRCTRLIIVMPPRHGKSEFTSKYFPAWALGLQPDWRVILMSYESHFASSWGRKVRDIMDGWGDSLFDLSVSRASSAAHSWDLDGHAGGMETAGVGGAMTGKGANLFIVDDPVKNADQALSPRHREKMWDLYTSTCYTRLEPDGRIIIILTRWHEDDLAGQVIKNMEMDEEPWEILRLPALSEGGGDLLGRPAGEALWPARYTADKLHRIERVIGPYWWNSLYQGKPTESDGVIFKRNWWHYYGADQRPSRFDQVIESWDCAFKDTDGSDYVVGQVWGRAGVNYYLLDMVRGRMNFPETCDAVVRLHHSYPYASAILVEDKANGPAVVATLKKLQGIGPKLQEVNPQGGKVARANATAPAAKAGNIWVPEPTEAPWVRQLLDEAAAFPRGTHDDAVDAMTQAIIWLTTGGQPYQGLFDFMEKALAEENRRQQEIGEKQRRKQTEDGWTQTASGLWLPEAA